MNADPAVQLRLLDLQAADTALAQLAHRRTHLPELARLAEQEARAAQLRNEHVDAQLRVDDLAADQLRLEGEVETVRSREGRDEKRLQAGGLPAKELEGLQHELVSLKRRQSDLEDQVLELMEAREEAEQALAGVVAQQQVIDGECAELTAARDAAFGEIDASTAARAADRDAIAAELPDDLVALYEKARAHGGGVGAAALRHRRCEGCRIELSGSELSAVRAAAPDAVLRCEECRRILVRTAESGL